MMLARILWIVGGLLLSLPTSFFAQGVSTIEYQGVQIVPSLAGVVRDPADTPLAGVLVEEFGSDWKTALRSAKTDQQGHFAMTTVKGRETYFLQFSSHNCNPIRVRVRVDAKHGKELQVKMVNST
ncbi:MAG: carboxypeptidase regulatory-like domain-containing protein [Candidatus Acidiferrum sp.]